MMGRAGDRGFFLCDLLFVRLHGKMVSYGASGDGAEHRVMREMAGHPADHCTLEASGLGRSNGGSGEQGSGKNSGDQATHLVLIRWHTTQ
jgi:hypothetical protein